MALGFVGRGAVLRETPASSPVVVTRGEGFLGVGVVAGGALVFGGNDTAKGVVGGEAGVGAVSQCLAGEARTPEVIVGVSATVVFDLRIAVNRKV